MTRIALLLSDVDGTLVTNDKRLTEASRRAVRRLGEQGIGFTITSSRPPFGMRMLVEALELKLPIGAFNGAALVAPDLSIIEQRLVPPAAARRAVGMLEGCGVDIWLFRGGRWLLRDPEGPYVDHERRTVAAEPHVVSSFEPYLDAAGKIVGVSADFDRLAACETTLREALGEAASVVRSQRYYLDVTPPGCDKGVTLDVLAQRVGIPPAEIATIGDMGNDLPMFRRGGFSIAMGNAPPEVQGAAEAVTASNEEDGFAMAVERFVLPRSVA